MNKQDRVDALDRIELLYDWALERTGIKELDLRTGREGDPRLDPLYLCIKCHRRFLNNISCPQCGWSVPR